MQELVEQIDNAGNLHGMGGLRLLLDLGVSGHMAVSESQSKERRRSESVMTLALWTLGVAVQNNEPVQAQMMEIQSLPPLIGQLPRCVDDASGSVVEDPAGSEYCGKLLYAISGLVKNNGTIQAAADSQGLFDWLLDAGLPHRSTPIVKKAMALLDIALSQTPNLQFLDGLPSKQDGLADVFLSHIRDPTSLSDIDLAEKALRLVNRFLTLRPMLFRNTFRSELSAAVSSAINWCKQEQDVHEELCEGLAALGEQAALALTARELTDDEL